MIRFSSSPITISRMKRTHVVQSILVACFLTNTEAAFPSSIRKKLLVKNGVKGSKVEKRRRLVGKANDKSETKGEKTKGESRTDKKTKQDRKKGEKNKGEKKKGGKTTKGDGNKGEKNKGKGEKRREKNKGDEGNRPDRDNCEVIKLFIPFDMTDDTDFVLADGTPIDGPLFLLPGGRTLVSYPLYADIEREDVVGFAQGFVDFTPGGGVDVASCIGTFMYGLNSDEEGTLQDGFSITGGCFSNTLIVSGGFGKYACAKGFEVLTEDVADGLDMVELRVCDACSSARRL